MADRACCSLEDFLFSLLLHWNRWHDGKVVALPAYLRKRALHYRRDLSMTGYEAFCTIRDDLGAENAGVIVNLPPSPHPFPIHCGSLKP